MKKAILVVSFGTSYTENREKTLHAIEKTIANKYGKIYTAYTSKMILKKILKRDGISFCNVTQAFEQMKKDGITDVLVQPTHILNGIENDLMKEDALAFEKDFNSIAFGDPLITTTEDIFEVVKGLGATYGDVSEKTAVVFMGHGSEHVVNTTYAAIDYAFKDLGYANFFMGTVEGYPELEQVIKLLKKGNYKNVLLAPFMIVAGDHANNDMIGNEEDSWLNQLTKEGFNVAYRMTGLGELSFIHNIFLNHIERVK